MSITSENDIAAGLSVSQHRPFMKVFSNPRAAGAFQSAWLAGSGAGVAPPAYTTGSGYACDRTTQGALNYVNATIQNYLARLSITSTLSGTFLIYDRLWSCSGMGFAAGTYTVTTPGSLPARITDDGVGCELWVEQFVAAGAASGTLSANYVEPGGTTGRTGSISAVQSVPVVGQMQPVLLQAGDTGIKQLTSITTSATWTSGSFGMTIAKRIAEISVTANMNQTFDWAQLGLPQIPQDACIFIIYLATAASAPVLICSMDFIDK